MTEMIYTKSEVDDLLAAMPGGALDTEGVQDAVALMLSQGAGISLSYDDAADTLTITGTSTGGLDAEAVRDAIGVALVGVPPITVSINDAADTIVISTTATGTYSKPPGGIPKSDLDAPVQSSLGKADTALQTIPPMAVPSDVPRAFVWNGTAWPTPPSDLRVNLFIGGLTGPTGAGVKNNDLWIS